MILSTIVPNNYFMPFESVKSWLKLERKAFVYAEGPDLDFNRNFVWRQVKDKNDHLLMIDSDIIFTPDDVERIEYLIEERGLDAVTGIYSVGMLPYPPCVFKRVHGEDISFCHRLALRGFKLWADSSVKLGHIRVKNVYPNDHRTDFER